MSATPPSRSRRFPRLGLHVLVDYVCPGGVRLEYATSVSAGGLFIESDDPLPVGTPLRLRFRVPGQNRLHTLQARVVWNHRPAALAESTSPPGMGVEFSDPVAAAEMARELEAWFDDPSLREGSEASERTPGGERG